MDENQTADIFESVVSEITNGQGDQMVFVNSDVLSRVTIGDDDPKFATFVIESGWSKSRRYWGPELFSDVAAEINQAAVHGEPIVGYMGHIKEEDDPFVFPEIQLQWVGARNMPTGDGSAKLAVKAYVLPGTKALDYLKRGLVKSVSWRGKVAQEAVQGGVKIKKFAIESIDLARPRSAGMSARMAGALSSEMETEGGNTLKPEEIAALQENELRAHNPALVSTIENSATAPLNEKVSEMETVAEQRKPVLAVIPQFRQALGLSEDVSDENVLLAAVSEIRKAGKQLRDSVLDTVLGKKFDTKDENFGLLRRAIVGEMTSKEFELVGDTDKDEKTVSEMVNEIIDGDEDLKKAVSEMEASPAAPPTSKPAGGVGSQRELKDGYADSSIRVRKVTR